MNLKIRLKDPLFILQMVGLVIGVITQAIAVNVNEITTWGKLGEVLLNILSNPYVLGTVIFNLVVGFVNLFRDPTTSGLNDSARAQEYESVNDSDVAYGIESAEEDKYRG